MKQQQSVTWMTALAVILAPAVAGAQSNPLGTAKMNPDVSAIVDMFYTNDDLSLIHI